MSFLTSGALNHRNFNLLFGNSGAANLPLNPFTAGLTGAFGLELLLSSYSGKAIRVRRSLDAAELDIGFVAGVLDTSTLLAFVNVGGGNNGSLVTWYDQSGAGNHLTVAPVGTSIAVVLAGVYLGAVRMNGGGGTMQSTNSTGAVPALSIFIDMTPISFNGLEFFAATPNTTGTSQALGASLDYSNNSLPNEKLEAALTSLGAGGRVQFTFGDLTLAAHVLGVRYNRAAGTNPAKVVLQVDGVERAKTSTIVSEAPGPLFDAQPWFFGPNSTANPNADYRSIALYETAVADLTMTAIATALA